jgi:hypothetical protein
MQAAARAPPSIAAPQKAMQPLKCSSLQRRRIVRRVAALPLPAATPTPTATPALSPHRRQTRPSVATAAEAGEQAVPSGAGGQPAPPPKGFFARLFARFDRLPAQTQMVVLTVLAFTAFSVVPFLQPTFLYGSRQDGSAAGSAGNIATVVPTTDARTGKALSKRAIARAEKQAERDRAAALVAQAEADAEEALKYQRMRELPVAGPVLGYLQDCAMPKKLPDGRTESPGAMRIYLASLVLLAVFYTASAVLQALINVFVAVLLKLGIIHVRRPPPSAPDVGGAAAA